MILKSSCETPLQSFDSKRELMAGGLKVALNQKGLRQFVKLVIVKRAVFESSPESEGIR